MEVRQTHLPGRPDAARREDRSQVASGEESTRQYAEARSSYGSEEGGEAPKNGSPQAGEAHARLNDLTASAYVAVDPASRRLLDQIHKIAQGNTSVLIRGESGVGKDLVASLLHSLGPQHDEPIAHIDCSSHPQELLEAELFGYEKGAFPGATQQKRGRLELAGDGTLVLDEIAALPMPSQAKLLRVIERKEFQRLGGDRVVKFSGRIMALTNVDLERAVARRSFREDLYYRLVVTQLIIPALRERPADIQPLAEHFLAHLSQVHRRPRPSFSADALRPLIDFDYPGNVRQLRNLINRVIVTCSGPEIQEEDLPAYIRHGTGRPMMTLEALESQYIAEVLKATQGRKSRTAEILGISRKTLLEKRKRYRLD